MAVPKTTTCPRLFYLQAYFFAIVVIIKLFFYFHCGRRLGRETEEGSPSVRPSIIQRRIDSEDMNDRNSRTLCTARRLQLSFAHVKTFAVNKGQWRRTVKDWGLFVVAWARFTALQSFRMVVSVVPSGGHIYRICLWKTCKRSSSLRPHSRKMVGVRQTVAGVNGIDNRTPSTTSTAATAPLVTLNKWLWWQWVTVW